MITNGLRSNNLGYGYLVVSREIVRELVAFMSIYFINDFIREWSKERISQSYSVEPSDVDIDSKLLRVMLIWMKNHMAGPFGLVN